MDGHLTIGVAGHVDHGKTALVRALSHVDTDRMKEEKRRGLSIEFGVALLVLPSGKQVNLVDAPGHRDFMKNAIRGLSCVNAAILVAAADDGVMPQTREHFEILRFFGVAEGFVVVSKADLVDQETLDMAVMEIQDLVKGSAFEAGPIIPFSSVEGRGTGEVLAAIEAVGCVDEKHDEPSKPFRMFIDQIRMFKGLGTVVSGTILSGNVHRGDKLEILPTGQIARIRSLETHHAGIEEAGVGARVGINLMGIGARELARGMVLAAPGSLQSAKFLNVYIELCATPGRTLRTGQRVNIHVGSAVTTGFTVIMGREELAPGDHGLAQFRLEEPIGAAPLDRFVIALMNSPVILGGGKILETTQVKYRKARAERTISYLMELQTGDPNRIVKAVTAVRPDRALSAEELSRFTGRNADGFELALARQAREGDLVLIGAGTYMATYLIREAKQDILSAVENILNKDALRDHVATAAIANAIRFNLEKNVLEFLLGELIREGNLLALDGGYSICEKYRKTSPTSDPVVQLALAVVEASGTASTTATLVWEALGCHQDKMKIKKILGYLVSKRVVVLLENERYISQKGLDHAKDLVREWISARGRIVPSDCKPVFGCGRMVGLPVLEHLDAIGFTVRCGNERFLKS